MKKVFFILFALFVLCLLPLFGFGLPADRKANLGEPQSDTPVLFWYCIWAIMIILSAALLVAAFEVWKKVGIQQAIFDLLMEDPHPGLGAELKGSITDLRSRLPWTLGGGFFTTVYYQTTVLFLAFLSSNYNVFVINFIKPIWSQFAKLEDAVPVTVSTTLIVGVIVGELTLGHMGDNKLGLNRAFLLAYTFVITAATATGLTHSFWIVSYFRFICGVGVGGSYPICAALSSAARNGQPQTRRDYTRTLLVFSSQGFGLVLANVVALVSVILIPTKPEISWRICSGGGAILAVIALCLFIQVPKPPQHKKHEAQNTWKMIKQNWRYLLGTGGAWFLFDIQFYANSLFTSKVLTLVFGSGFSLQETLVQNLLVTAIPLIGFAVAGICFRFTNLSIKWMQILGFIGMTILYFAIGIWLDYIQTNRWLFLILYALTFVFANAGPNSTTFILPAVVYEESSRATCHGLSAASGKVGAVIGSAAMDPLLNAFGLKVVLYICGAIGVAGIILTLICIPNSSSTPPSHSMESITSGQSPDASPKRLCTPKAIQVWPLDIDHKDVITSPGGPDIEPREATPASVVETGRQERRTSYRML